MNTFTVVITGYWPGQTVYTIEAESPSEAIQTAKARFEETRGPEWFWTEITAEARTA